MTIMSTEETTTIVIPPREDSQEWHGPPPLSSESPREPDSPTDSVKAGGMARQTKYKVRTIPFLRQLKKMIEEEPGVIKWDHGNIIIPDPKALEKTLPLYYKHNNYASFQRQLNNFGYHRKFAHFVVNNSGQLDTVYHKLGTPMSGDIEDLLSLRPVLERTSDKKREEDNTRQRPYNATQQQTDQSIERAVSSSSSSTSTQASRESGSPSFSRPLHPRDPGFNSPTNYDPYDQRNNPGRYPPPPPPGLMSCHPSMRMPPPPPHYGFHHPPRGNPGFGYHPGGWMPPRVPPHPPPPPPPDYVGFGGGKRPRDAYHHQQPPPPDYMSMPPVPHSQQQQRQPQRASGSNNVRRKPSISSSSNPSQGSSLHVHKKKRATTEAAAAAVPAPGPAAAAFEQPKDGAAEGATTGKKAKEGLVAAVGALLALSK